MQNSPKVFTMSGLDREKSYIVDLNFTEPLQTGYAGVIIAKETMPTVTELTSNQIIRDLNPCVLIHYVTNGKLP